MEFINQETSLGGHIGTVTSVTSLEATCSCSSGLCHQATFGGTLWLCVGAVLIYGNGEFLKESLLGLFIGLVFFKQNHYGDCSLDFTVAHVNFNDSWICFQEWGNTVMMPTKSNLNGQTDKPRDNFPNKHGQCWGWCWTSWWSYARANASYMAHWEKMAAQNNDQTHIRDTIIWLISGLVI